MLPSISNSRASRKMNVSEKRITETSIPRRDVFYNEIPAFHFDVGQFILPNEDLEARRKRHGVDENKEDFSGDHPVKAGEARRASLPEKDQTAETRSIRKSQSKSIYNRVKSSDDRRREKSKSTSRCRSKSTDSLQSSRSTKAEKQDQAEKTSKRKSMSTTVDDVKDRSENIRHRAKSSAPSARRSKSIGSPRLSPKSTNSVELRTTEHQDRSLGVHCAVSKIPPRRRKSISVDHTIRNNSKAKDRGESYDNVGKSADIAQQMAVPPINKLLRRRASLASAFSFRMKNQSQFRQIPDIHRPKNENHSERGDPRTPLLKQQSLLNIVDTQGQNDTTTSENKEDTRSQRLSMDMATKKTPGRAQRRRRHTVSCLQLTFSGEAVMTKIKSPDFSNLNQCSA